MNAIKKQFPFFCNNKNFIYGDNAATTHKPYHVLDVMHNFYSHSYATPYRGTYDLSEQATQDYEKARKKIADFIGSSVDSVVMTYGATDALNRVAISWGEKNINEGDEIVISIFEHHANFLPWQQLCLQKKAILKIIPATINGDLDYVQAEKLITSKTKLVAITAVSNAIGLVVDIKKIISFAKNVEAKVLVDASQSVSFFTMDLTGIDFYIFSGHKMMGPLGIGVLYISKHVQQECFPYPLGGGSVVHVTKESVDFFPFPHSFEAGTLPIVQAIGLAQAIQWIDDNGGRKFLHKHTNNLIQLCIHELLKIPYIQMIGNIENIYNQGHMISFTVNHMHAHDVAALLNVDSIAVRAGNHCAQPLAEALGYKASVRISLYVYNTEEDVHKIIACLKTL